MMTFPSLKIALLILASFGIIWISRFSLSRVKSHGFYRFLAWETLLIMFFVNTDFWFFDPFSFRQIISWLFLLLSLVLIFRGVQTLKKHGGHAPARNEKALYKIERTNTLVRTGIYRHIRHPFYSSLLFLGWGILFKNINTFELICAAFLTALLILTAKQEERENIELWGNDYREYMRSTKMFVPFLF